MTTNGTPAPDHVEHLLTCPQCGRIFAHPDHLSLHTRAAHTERPPS